MALRKPLTTIVATLGLCASPLYGGELQRENDTRFVHLLNAGEIIAEIGYPESVYSVRVVKAAENGECDGSPDTCPKTTLYVAVSETGAEYPEESVFVFPPLNDYQFDGWLELPKSDRAPTNVRFRIITSEASPDPAKGWWIERRYVVNVNPSLGFVGPAVE